MIATPSTTPDKIATGRLRPARLVLGGVVSSPIPADAGGVSEELMAGGCEVLDLEQLGFLVLEHLVDLVDVLLGDAVEPLLRAGHVVLPDVAVGTELLQRLLGVTTY